MHNGHYLQWSHSGYESRQAGIHLSHQVVHSPGDSLLSGSDPDTSRNRADHVQLNDRTCNTLVDQLSSRGGVTFQGLEMYSLTKGELCR